MIKQLLIGLFISIGLFTSYPANSQSDYSAIWTDYNHTNNLKGKWTMTSDYGYRFRLNYSSFWQRIHARTGFVYHTKNVKLLSGLGLFFVFLPGKVSDFEIRPWQGVKYSWPHYERLKFNHFVRLEERIHFLGTSGNKAFNYFELKFRYSLMMKYSFTHSKKWTALFGFEPFLNIYVKDTPLSVAKSRTTVGFSFAPSSKTRFRLTYIYQPQNIPILQDQGLYSNIIRLSIIQKIHRSHKN